MTNQVYIPLKEAAKKNDLDVSVLTQLIAAGLIEAKEEDGETLVAVDKNGNGTNSQTKEDLIAANFAELQGQPITLSQAAKKYDVPRGTINSWFRQSGYTSPITTDDYPIKFDEGEIAYLVDIYRQRRAQHSRAPLLDSDGLPYRIMHPELARYRRRRIESI